MFVLAARVCVILLNLCWAHAVRNPISSSLPPPPNPGLLIYLNLCDFNEIGSLLAGEHNQSQCASDSTTLPTIHKSIKDVFQFAFICLHFACFSRLFCAFPFVVAAAAVGQQKCQAINKSISRLSGILVICIKSVLG